MNPFIEDDQHTETATENPCHNENGASHHCANLNELMEFFPDGVESNSDQICVYCGEGSNESICQCVECGRWFCNGKSHLSASHIVLHFTFSRHKSVRLHPNNELGGDDLECFICGAKNIFNMGFIHSMEEDVVVLVCREPCLFSRELQDLNWDSQSWLPLIHEKQICPWLLKPKESAGVTLSYIKHIESELCNYIDKQPLVQDGDGPIEFLQELPLKFTSVIEYKKAFKALLEVEAIVNREINDRQVFQHLPGQWKSKEENELWRTLTLPEASSMDKSYLIIQFPLNDQRHFSSGDKVMVKGEPSSSDTPFLECFVVSVRLAQNGGYILILILDQTKVSSESRRYWHQQQQQESLCTQFTLKRVFNQTLYERMLEALQSLHLNESSMDNYLRQSILGISEYNTNLNSVDVHLPKKLKFNLNDSQALAVRQALLQSLTLIQGPPGTGKTTTSVAIVYYLHATHKSQILVCAPSNVAIDHLAGRISAAGLNVVRVEARSRESLLSTVDHLTLNTRVMKHIQQMSEKSTLRQLFNLREQIGYLMQSDERIYMNERRKLEKQIIEKAEVLCVTCSSAGSPTFSKSQFQYVVVDEATQAIEPEILISLVHGAKQVVLVGDQCQMSSVVVSQAAASAGLGRSLFERLIILGSHRPFRLDIQYRMHPCLSEFPSQYFYEGTLQNGVTALERDSSKVFPWPNPEKPLLFYNSVRPEEISANGFSYLNRAEASLAEQIVTMLIRDGDVNPKAIGIITPYEGQYRYVSNFLSRNGPLGASVYKDVEVASVDSFQGREKEFIVLSCVRSNDQQGIGFLKDWRRLNVSLTRAQRGLFIIGNARVLSSHPLWHALIESLIAQSLLVDGPLSRLTPARVALQNPRMHGDLQRSTDAYRKTISRVEVTNKPTPDNDSGEPSLSLLTQPENVPNMYQLGTEAMW